MSPVKDKVLDNIEFRRAAFVGSKIMPSAMYDSTIFPKEKKGNYEYDAVRKGAHTSNSTEFELEVKEAGVVLTARVYLQWHILSICLDKTRSLS